MKTKIERYIVEVDSDTGEMTIQQTLPECMEKKETGQGEELGRAIWVVVDLYRRSLEPIDEEWHRQRQEELRKEREAYQQRLKKVQEWSAILPRRRPLMTPNVLHDDDESLKE